MSDENQNIITLRNVSKLYRINEHSSVGVRNINFEARRGELVLFLGPSGSGKTTLLTLIAGLLEPSNGSVTIYQKEITSYSKAEMQRLRSGKIGFVFQTFFLIEALTALENIELVLKFVSKKKKEARKIAEQLLIDFSIEHLRDKLPSTMSQGEKQRVAVARAVANDADIILADEPTASLDAANGSEIIVLLKSYARKNNKCVIVVSHDLRLKEFSDRIIYIEDGMIINQASDIF